METGNNRTDEREKREIEKRGRERARKYWDYMERRRKGERKKK